MTRAVIITSYLEYPVDIPALLEADDYVVCLDGGFDIALRQGIRPHLLLGDFDSMQAALPDDPAITIRRYPPEKDYTDLELAFRILDPEKTPEILVIGGLGGRLDQTLTNVQMLARYTAGAYRRILLMDGHNQCFAVHGDGGVTVHYVPRQENSFLSLIPLTDRCCGVTVSGVKYPLVQADILRGTSYCTSNEFSGSRAELTLDSGSLLVVVARGNAADTLADEA